jgi:transcriptional regulator with XRE-family HTH domain
MKRNSLPERIGAALRRRREAQEISQEAFAEAVGMHRTYYSAIERGRKNMRLETLEKICTALRSRMSEVIKEAE